MKKYFALLLTGLSAWAATPNVTVTLTSFTVDYSGAGYVVRLTPTTGGTPMRAVTAANSVATFTAVTPALYNLSFENLGIQTLLIRVPNVAGPVAASSYVLSDWTAPGPSASALSPWFRGVPYLWPSAQATAAGMVLTNDASGNLGWKTLTGTLGYTPQNGAASYEDAHLAWWWDGRSSFSQPIVYLWGTVEPLAGAWSKDSQYDNNWNNFVWELGPSWPDGVYPWNNEPVFPEAPVVIKHGKKLGHNK